MNVEVLDADYRPLAAVREDNAPAVQPFFGAMRPAEKIAYAAEIADALKPVLTQKKLVHKLNSRNPDDEYVELEGWQTCGNLCGVTAKVEWTKALPDGSGYEARAIVIRVDNGVVIGGGESVCSRSEQKWKTRDDFALKGMAQTRAQSRALRGVLAWILVLAGYKPTPAEEMPDHDTAPLRDAAPANPRHSQRVARVPQDELLALAASRGVADIGALGRWCVAEGIAPDLMDRAPKKLSDAETVAARDRLLALPLARPATKEGAAVSAGAEQVAPEVGIAPPPPAPPAWRMTHPQRGLLMRAYARAWGSAKGGVTDEKRHAFAERVLGPGKGSSASWDRDDFDAILKALEAEESDGLRAHARAMFGDES